MALSATMRRFEIVLADSDRGVYETLDLRVAQHPSESERFLVARVLARALEHAEGLEFGGGVSTGDEPALWGHDLRGDLTSWIEVGAPSVERLHKASKKGVRVAVYGWKGVEALVQEATAAKVHRLEKLEFFAFDPDFLDVVAGTLERNNRWDLSVTGGSLYLGIAGETHESAVRPLRAA